MGSDLHGTVKSNKIKKMITSHVTKLLQYRTDYEFIWTQVYVPITLYLTFSVTLKPLQHV